MKLALIDDAGIVHTIVEEVEDYDLAKPLPRVEVMNQVSDAVTRLQQGRATDPMVEAMLRQYGLPANSMGQLFILHNRHFTLAGVKPRGHKYPFIGKGTQGGRYKFTADQVRRGFEASGFLIKSVETYQGPDPG